MESKVIYSRYNSFLVGLSNGISSLHYFFQRKVKFKNVRADIPICAFSLLGGWCVVSVFQPFVVLCENSLWHEVEGERPIGEKSRSQ